MCRFLLPYMVVCNYGMGMKFTSKSNKLAIRLMKENPDLRDDFMQFVAVYWRNQIPEEDHTKSCFVLLGKIFRKEIEDPRNLSRIWRQIQANIPELRGNSWKDRQKHSKDEVPNQIYTNQKAIEKEVAPDLFDEGTKF